MREPTYFILRKGAKPLDGEMVSNEGLGEAHVAGAILEGDLFVTPEQHDLYQSRLVSFNDLKKGKGGRIIEAF